jgi:hypothetical protein
MLLPPFPKLPQALEVSLPTDPAAAQTSSFVVEVPLVTAVPPKAGVVTLPPTVVTCVPLTLESVALLATSPLTASVALPVERSASTLATETVVLLMAGVVLRLLIAVPDARRVLATAL